MTTDNTQIREVKEIIEGLPSSDGDGVKLTRIIGTPQLDMLDPFLLFDAFSSDQPQDYIGGFPSHPHRGFETVTYMLSGKMRHKDSVGNEGVISAGDVQWMTAGKGIIHSEMPEQESGMLAGFQLWVNLPASQKMTEPNYQEIPNDEIPVEKLAKSGSLKVIAGITRKGTRGKINNQAINPLYWDVNLKDGYTLSETLPKLHNAFVYVIKGEIKIGNQFKKVKKGQIAVLTNGGEIKISNASPAQYLLIAGKQLKEPVHRGGPFVMNSKAEIYQAFADYQNGTFA